MLNQLSKLTNNVLDVQKKFNSNFVFDSRKIKPGDIFVGIKTKNDNGSKYFQRALDRGCSLAIIDKNIINSKCLYSPDVFKFLKFFSNHKLNSYGGKIIAITGSVGKTTLKENLYNIFKSNNFKTYKSFKNYNNELGLLINVCNLDPSSSYGIFEIGINKSNEMKNLMQILDPQYVLITNIENSHIGNFVNFKSLVNNKMSLMSSSKLIKGLVNFNYSNDQIYKKYISNNKINLINLNKDIFIISVRKFNLLYKIIFRYNHKKETIYSESSNSIHIHNAILSFYFVQLIIDKPKKNIFFFNKSIFKGHGNILNVKKNNLNFILFDHSYNASPYSMKENLLNFIKLSPQINDKIFILGSMKELGLHSVKYHVDIINMISQFNNKFFIGEEFCKFSIKNNQFFINAIDSLDLIKSKIKNNSKIFVMGSRSNQLDIIVKKLC